MRIPHRNLEQARSNPLAYVRQAAATSAIYRMSAFRLWQFAIREYHRTNQNLALAERYLDSKFRRTFAGGQGLERRLLEFKAHLGVYAQEFIGLGHNALGVSERLSMDLGHGVSMTGEIGRVDLVISGGYAAYLFLKEQTQWRDELRMPLLQANFADKFSVPTVLVRVGVYTLELGEHEDTQFSQRYVAGALQEGADLARRLIVAHRRL